MKFRYRYTHNNISHLSDSFSLNDPGNAGKVRAEILAEKPDAHSFMMQMFVDGVPAHWEDA